MFFENLDRPRKVLLIFLSLFLTLSGSEATIEKDHRSSHMLKDLGLENDQAIRNGKQKLKDFNAVQNPCWTKAVKELRSKCSEMTDIEQSILAIRFANCHFAKSGLKTYNCTNIAAFQNCTKSMKEDDDASFLAYTEFFTHVTNICFYIQSEIWRQKTAATISMLSQTTENTISKLDKSLQNQDLVLKYQGKTISNQRIIMKSEENLKHTLEASTKSAKAAFNEMKQRAADQEALFSQTFENLMQGIRKLTTLQTMFLGEFINLESLAFYLVSIISCYFFTSTPRTLEARLLLFTLFALLVFIEKVITDRALKYKDIHGSTTEWIHNDIWFARRAFIATSVFILGYHVVKYKDVSKINNQLLKEIKDQLEDISYRVDKREPKVAIESDHNSPKQIGINSRRDLISCEPPTCSTPLLHSSTALMRGRPSANTPNTVLDITAETIVDEEARKISTPVISHGQRITKKFSIKNFVKQSPDSKKCIAADADQYSQTGIIASNTRNSRYNLRPRSTTPTKPQYYSSSFNKPSHKRQQKTLKLPNNSKETRFNEAAGLFSSDDEY